MNARATKSLCKVLNHILHTDYTAVYPEAFFNARQGRLVKSDFPEKRTPVTGCAWIHRNGKLAYGYYAHGMN